MINRIVILAAGKGTRMRHLSADRPKHLISVRGRPFIAHLLDRLLAAGFDECVLVIGYRADVFRQWLSTTEYPIVTVEQPMGDRDRQGTAAAVAVAETATKGEPFVVVSGDNLYAIEDLASFRQDDGFHRVAGFRSATPERYGVLVTREDGRLERIIEKPETFVGETINAALYAFQPEVFDEIRRLRPSPRGEYEITDAISALASRGRVRVSTIRAWDDFGRPEDVAALEGRLAEGHNDAPAS